MDVISIIRGSAFFGALIIFSLLQLIIPSRPFPKDRWQFMLSNLVLVGGNTLLIALLPLIPYQMAVVGEIEGYGLLNSLSLPLGLDVVIGLLIMDITIYFQHRLFHQNNLLWRFHSMHHIDPMLDTTSGLRFHPIEMVISILIKVSIIFVIGVSPVTVIGFELALNLFAMFNHSNIKIHPNLEKILNKLLITPALHTIHHSKIYKETNSNYGFSVPWWDMLFKTFIPHGKYSQENINIGIPSMPEEKYQLFPWMLIQPFLK